MRAIAITGGKGGVGKTTLSAAISMALAEKSKRVVLFDADLALANLDVLLGLKAEFNLQHIVNEEKTLKEILVDGPGGIHVACGASAIGSLMNAGPKRLRQFFSQVFSIENESDYLVFDTGSGIDRRVMSFLKAADDVVVVATPDPASITDAYATMKVLFRNNKYARVHVVVNNADNEIEAHRVFQSLSAIAKQFLKQDIWFLGVVYHDNLVTKAVRSRKCFFTEYPDSQASGDVRTLAERVIELDRYPTMSFTERVLKQESAA